jgi:FkbM family methyltransferase
LGSFAAVGRVAIEGMSNKDSKLTPTILDRINGTIIKSNISGKVIYFFIVNEEDVIQSHHAKGEFYELEELSIIQHYVRQGSVILEVGSNVGNHILFYEKFLNPQKIIAIEPNPIAIRVLNVNLNLNSCSTVDLSYLGIGLSDRKFKANISYPQNNWGGARLIFDDRNEIPVETGDRLFSQQNIDFIKIDVEGEEIQVLKGLELTIQRSRPLIFIEIFNENIEDFERWLMRQNYIIAERYQRYKFNTNYMSIPAEFSSVPDFWVGKGSQSRNGQSFGAIEPSIG